MIVSVSRFLFLFFQLAGRKEKLKKFYKHPKKVLSSPSIQKKEKASEKVKSEL